MNAEMIERVARAICDTSHCDGSVWGDAAEGFRELFRDEARAAIAAMREPTKAMLREWDSACPPPGRDDSDDWARADWHAMIDEALK